MNAFWIVWTAFMLIVGLTAAFCRGYQVGMQDERCWRELREASKRPAPQEGE
jgi:hypothetical protein